MVNMISIEPQNTLHLLTAAPRLWSTFMSEIMTVWQTGDLILLIGESAQGFNAKALESFNQIAVLDTDLTRLEVAKDDLPNHIQVATIADWAAWTVQYQRTVTWR